MPAARGALAVRAAAPGEEEPTAHDGGDDLLLVLGGVAGELELLGLYEPEGFVFPTRNGTCMTMSNLR